MKKLFAVSLVIVLAMALTACGGSSTYEDGTYTAQGVVGDRGYVEATVTIEGDEITNISFVEYTQFDEAKDYATYGREGTFDGNDLQEAHEALAAAMVEANSWEVDDVTGATSTSEKAKLAVEVALDKALVDADSEFVNGTFMGVSSMDDRGGMVVALVTINNDEITAVNLRETTRVDDALEFKDYETYGSEAAGFTGEDLQEAHETMAARFVEANDTDVELVSGATGTSEKAIEAVVEALNNARR